MRRYVLSAALRASLCAALTVCGAIDEAFAQGVSAPWTAQDIGAPALVGSTTYASGAYTIKAVGADIWDTSDQFHFVYQPITGNVEIVVRVASVSKTHVWSRGGVMIRESLSAESRHAMASLSAGKGYAFQRRLEPGAYTEHTAGGNGTAPGWLKLVRTGDLFEAYRSSNGTTWTKMGSDIIAMGETVYVGLAATSRHASKAAIEMFDSLTVTAATSSNEPPAVSIMTPTTGTTVTAPATVTITATATDRENRLASVDFYAGSTLIVRDTAAPYSASWSAVSPGTHALTAVAHDADGGSTTSSVVNVVVKVPVQSTNEPPSVSLSTSGLSFTAGATITLAATASDPEGRLARVEFFNGTKLLAADTTAPYSFAWSNVAAGVYALTAVAYDADGASATSSAVNVTVQAANAAPTVSLTSPIVGQAFTAPATIALAATASDPENQVARVEFFNGTTRLATDTTAPYAFNWTDVAAGTYSLTAVVYDGAGASATSAARTVTVSAGTSLPEGWTNTDIGSHALSGNATYSDGVFSVDAGGADIWDAADEFHFVYQAVSGDVDIVARVDSLTEVHQFTSAGVMIRASLTPGSIHAYAALSAGGGVYWRPRISTDGPSIAILGSNAKAPVWVRLVRQGTLFTSYWSTDGNTWLMLGSQTLALADTAYVGLAVNGHDEITRTSARLSNVRLGTPSPNQSPTVSLSTSGLLSFTAGATITLAATASDPEGELARVEFFNGTTRLGIDTTAPYSFAWPNVAAGTYTLTAVAYDAAGASSTSAALTVTVAAVPTANVPSGVAFTASSDHATSVTRYVLKIFAAGASLTTATPVATSDLGKPTPETNGEIVVDRSALFSALAVGNYVATVTAVGPGGEAQSTSVPFIR